MDLDRLKEETVELNVWASSCMVALANRRPVAILVGAKREGVTLVQRIGVHPEYARRGHGHHLMRSLSAKLAIMGPPRLLAEVPADAGLEPFFERVGYHKIKQLCGFSLAAPLPPLPSSDAIQTLPAEEALQQRHLWPTEPAAWERAMSGLVRRQKKLSCLALLAAEGIAAVLLYWRHPYARRLEVLRFGGGDRERSPLYHHLLLRKLYELERDTIHIPKLDESEIPFRVLSASGFEKNRIHDLYEAHAAAY